MIALDGWAGTGLTALLCAVLVWVGLAGGGIVINAVRRLLARRDRDLGSVQRESVQRAAREQEGRDCELGCQPADPEAVRRLLATPTEGQDLTRSYFPWSRQARRDLASEALRRMEAGETNEQILADLRERKARGQL